MLSNTTDTRGGCGFKSEDAYSQLELTTQPGVLEQGDRLIPSFVRPQLRAGGS